jgi:N6-L-threonylcarbamoyladenine synthase
MKILAIETSCDETAVCIIEASGDIDAGFKYEVLGNALYSQVAIHAPYGGVFPNLAKREHAKNLIPLLQETLQQSDLLAKGLTFDEPQQSHTLIRKILEREPELLEQLQEFLAKHEKPDIGAIAVTYGPGLEPALWVGVNLARALSIIWDIPLVAVNHMEGHIMMSAMQDGTLADFRFPLLSLLISGGHTELVLSREFMHYELVGQTRDDAVGEAFDKVARLLGLPYPGGPEISRLAAQAREERRNSFSTLGETVSPLTFTPPMLHSKDFDFSFSGLKTEVRKFAEAQHQGSALMRETNQEDSLSEDMKKEIARAFEDAVAHVLVQKTLKAVEEFGVATVIVGGGVSANAYIRKQLSEALCKDPDFTGMQLLVPPADLATDNALMIALTGYFHAIKKDFADPATLRANGNLRLA